MAGMRTQLAKQALVRYIREGNLKTGAQLPPQEELRQRLGFGTATIAAALHELRNDRVIEVRDKIGAFVLNPEADGHAGRIIGLAVNALEVSAFRSCLSSLLQIRLAERGWRVLPFFCMAPQLDGRLEYTAFAGLHRTVEQGGIEALITLGDLSAESLDYFEAKKLPVIFVGCLETRSVRVVVDMPAYLEAALDKLKGAGIHRPAILIPEALREQLTPRFENALRHFPGAGKAEELILTGNFVPEGAQAARRLLALPEAQRPDGVVTFDDTLASSFVAELFRSRDSGYHPRMAILRNLQNPMDFATDNPFCFAVDLNVLAGLTAELLGDLFNGSNAQARHHVPQYIQP